MIASIALISHLSKQVNEILRFPSESRHNPSLLVCLSVCCGLNPYVIVLFCIKFKGHPPVSSQSWPRHYVMMAHWLTSLPAGGVSVPPLAVPWRYRRREGPGIGCWTRDGRLR